MFIRVLATARVSVVIGFIVFGLAACGGSSSQSSGSSSSPNPTNCGSISTNPRGIVTDAGAVTAENCFASAFARCQAATLTFSMNGIDGGAIHKLTVTHAASGCAVTDDLSTFTAPGTPKPAGTHTCTTVKQNQSGLVIGACNDIDDIVIPAPSASAATE